MKKSLLSVISVLYLAIVACFTFYWANNFQKYVHFKGDEFGMCVEFIIPLTYAFFILAQLNVRRAHFVILLFLPVIIAIASFFLGILILLVTGMSGTPAQTIYLYCSVYSLASFLFIKMVWTSKEGKISSNR